MPRARVRITVITPSFNQAEYLEEAIRSVLLQGYPNLEYLVVDGGSTDGSVDIIRRYEPWISWWCSEPDGGQADALAKGLDRATGRIFNWINSDDRLEPGALDVVARNMRTGVDAVAGACRFVHESEERVECVRNQNLQARAMIAGRDDVTLCQPSFWVLTDRVRELGGFNRESNFYFDSELFIRYLSCWPRVRYVDETIATFRIHGQSKTGSGGDGFRKEYVRALRRLALDAPTRMARRQAADRLRELRLHSRLLEAFRQPSFGRRLAASLPVTKAEIRPSLARIRLRWTLTILGLMPPPIGDVAELREIASWSATERRSQT